MADDTVQKFQVLKTAVDAWAEAEKLRLQADAAFLTASRLQQSKVSKISAPTTSKMSTLAFKDVDDFIKT
jgi:hypothetical protein